MIYAMTFGEQKMQSFLLSIVLSLFLFSDFVVIDIEQLLLSSSCIPLSLYLTVSHRLENGIWPKIRSRGGRRAWRAVGLFSTVSKMIDVPTTVFACSS